MEDAITASAPPKRYEWLNPTQVLGYGVLLYMVDDPDTDPTDRAAAREEVSMFLSLTAELDTEDQWYLSSARQIAILYGRALKRKKREWKAALKRAEERFQEKKDAMTASYGNSWYMNFAIKMGLSAFVGAIGYWIAQAMAPYIPVTLGASTGHKAPAWLLAIALGIFARWLMRVWDQWKLKQMQSIYDWEKDTALLLYEEGRTNEQNAYLENLIEEWEIYVQKKHTRSVAYLNFRKLDLVVMKANRDKIEVMSRSELGISILLLGKILRFMKSNCGNALNGVKNLKNRRKNGKLSLGDTVEGQG